MDKLALEQRLAELRANLEQIQANGNATLGAIAEIERLLKIVEQENKPAE